MKIAIFDLQPHEKKMFNELAPEHRLYYFLDSIQETKLSDCREVEVLSVFVNSKITAEIIKQFPKLKLIVARSTGYDNIDLKTCKKKKIIVCNVPSYGENTVAEHAFALLLSVARKLPNAWAMNLAKKYQVKDLKGFDLRG